MPPKSVLSSKTVTGHRPPRSFVHRGALLDFLVVTVVVEQEENSSSVLWHC